tara:strand:+ start:316 stop:945 length:630 start_codon:yes stop_codon:yes gene_type:complete
MAVVELTDGESNSFDHTNISDEKLFYRVQRDDIVAFEEIVERYRGRLYNCIYRMVHNTECAEDLLQETFLRVYRKRRNYKAISSLSTWIYTIALNLSRSELRKRKRRKFFSLDSPNYKTGSKERFELPDKTSGPGEKLETNELGRAIQHAIDLLPEKYKTVIILRDIEEMSYEEIGDILGCPTGTIKSRVNRARLKLQEKLRQWRLEIL